MILKKNDLASVRALLVILMSSTGNSGLGKTQRVEVYAISEKSLDPNRAETSRGLDYVPVVMGL